MRGSSCMYHLICCGFGAGSGAWSCCTSCSGVFSLGAITTKSAERSDCNDSVCKHRGHAEDQAGNGNRINRPACSYDFRQVDAGDGQLRHVFEQNDGQHSVANSLERFRTVRDAKPALSTFPHRLQVQNEQDGSDDGECHAGVPKRRPSVLACKGDGVHPPIAHEVKDPKANKEGKPKRCSQVVVAAEVVVGVVSRTTKNSTGDWQ